MSKVATMRREDSEAIPDVKRGRGVEDAPKGAVRAPACAIDVREVSHSRVSVGTCGVEVASMSGFP